MIYLLIVFLSMLSGLGLGIFFSTYYYPNIYSIKLLEYFYVVLILALLLFVIFLLSKRKIFFILFLLVSIPYFSFLYSSIKSKQRLDNLLRLDVKQSLKGVVKVSFLNKIFIETPEFTTLAYLKDFDKEFSYIGSEILVLGKTKHIYHYLTNKNMYGYFIYLFSNNIPFVVYTDEEKIGEVSRTENLFFSLVNDVRQNIYDTFSKYLVHTSSISVSLIMGESSEMSREFRENVRISGISHIFSVSGFHVGVIVFALVSFLGIFKLPKWGQFLVVSVFLVMYCFIVGLKPPVVRSSILASMILLVRSLGASPNYLNITLLTGIVMLILNPFLSVDVGFILSFLAVISIILFSGYVSDMIVSFFNKHNIEPGNFLSGLIALFSVSLVSVLFTLPVVVLWFGSSSITGVVSSLVLVPLSSLNIVGGIMGYFSYLVIPSMGEYIFRTVNFLNLVFMMITELFSKLGFIVKFNLGNVLSYLVFFLVYYSLVVFLFFIVSRRVRISIWRKKG